MYNFDLHRSYRSLLLGVAAEGIVFVDILYFCQSPEYSYVPGLLFNNSRHGYK